jgi:hypothetical protein
MAAETPVYDRRLLYLVKLHIMAQPTELPRKRRINSRGGFFLLLLLALLLLFFVLKQLGVNPVEVTDDSEIIEHPHR